jgi:hypothetical protein
MAPDKHDLRLPFCCPVCDHERYEPVMGSHRGQPFHTGIFRCAGCGFGFIDPTRYATSVAAELSESES